MSGLVSSILVLLLASLQPLRAEVKLDQKGKARANGDFRFRFESDWDSQRADGSEREDRDRLRIRARFEMKFQPAPDWTIGFRLRSGSTASQQSPHITIVDFDDNPRGDQGAVFDKYYIQFSGQKLWAWAGRNNFPFWKQNELFWDDDATPAGVAVGLSWPWSKGDFAFKTGFFALPDGGIDFNGRLGALQGVLTAKTKRGNFLAAGGVFRFIAGKGASHLRNGNGARDYTILVGNLQAELQAGELPLRLGLDLMHNSQNYSIFDLDPFTAAHRGQNNGAVACIELGHLKDKGNWLGGYYYAYIEALAVNASFAQDDWVRWGSGGQTDSSDFKGHELRLGYALNKNADLLARLYLVEAISSAQDGKRFRLDFNFKF